MSTPAISFREAIQFFSDAQEKDTYISHSMSQTKDKKDSASYKEITTLVQIAIHGLKQQIHEKPESCEKLQAQVQAVRDYLFKVKDASEAADISRIYLDLFTEVEAELKELAAIDDSIYQQELKIFSDADLSEIIYKLKVKKFGSDDFQKLGFKSQKTKIRFAKLAAQRNPCITSEHIQSFGIRDQNALVEIAKLACSLDAKACKFIQNFGIKDQTVLIEIAKELVVSRKGSSVSAHIQKFGIKDQAALIEIAKLAVTNHIHFISNKIQNYGIKDQGVLIRIASLVAQESLTEVMENIQNFGIEDQDVLIKFAMLVTKQPLVGTNISYHIQNFGIKDQNVLNKIAMLAAQYPNGEISDCIKNYGITDKKLLIEIAKVAAEQSSSIDQYIQDYGIDHQDSLIEIAKISAKKHGGAPYIQNYGIKDQNALIEIAKIAATSETGGFVISHFIYSYGISDKTALVEIAKLAIRHDDRNIRLLENYHFEDQNTLIEIAKICAQTNGEELSKQINAFGIKDETQLLEIFALAFKNNPTSILYIENFNFSKFKEIHTLSENSSLSQLQKAFPWPEEFSPIFKELSQEAAPKKEDIFFIIYLGCKLLQRPPLLKDPSVWGSIVQYKDDKMRYELADRVFALDEKQVAFYKDFSTPKHLQLPALFFCFSSQNKEDAKGYHDLLKDRREFRDGMMLKVLLDALYPLIVLHHFTSVETTCLLKAALNGHIQANLYSIQGTLSCGGVERLKKEAKSMTPDLDAAYQSVFREAIPIKPIEDFSIKYTQTFGKCALPSAPLIYAGGLQRLPMAERELALASLATFVYSVLEGNYPKNRYELSGNQDKEDQEKHLKMIFDKKPSLKVDWPSPKDIERPLEEFLEDSSEKISFDPKQFLMKKVFREEHLSKDKYPLLHQYLETKDSKIPKGLSESFAKLDVSNKERTRQKVNLRNALSSLNDIEKQGSGKDNVVKILGALVKAGHLLENLPGIKESLSGIEKLSDIEKPDPADPEFIKNVQFISDRFKKAAAASRLQLSAYSEEHQRLLVQKDLMDLYENEKTSLLDRLNLLTIIQVKLKKSGEELLNDITGIIETLKKQKQSWEGYTVTNTDRFDLLLLCGTQVQGSCQRIDGDPNLNKCLLAYMLDGKNRLLAIKDKEGRIVARSILRLLWDNQNKCPVLMKEETYSNVLDESLLEALDKFAVAEAGRLGLDLYEPDDEGSSSLESFGGPAPWEYVDSAEGVEEDCKFTVNNAAKVEL